MPLSTAQLTGMRRIANRYMVTPISIQRRVLGDSVMGDKDQVTYATVASLKGWFYSRPTPVADAATGQLTTVNTYRLLVPVGTDIRAGDLVLVGTDTYVVSDTTGESTWIAYLNVSLRKRE
jgi:hypothetical protein